MRYIKKGTVMQVDFKFNVGQRVTTKAIREMMIARTAPAFPPTILTILDQVTNTCSAGTQISYTCRETAFIGGGEKLMLYHECELTADLSAVEPEKEDSP